MNKHLEQILEFIKEERKTKSVLPVEHQVLRALNYFSPEECKVIIIGQDPYPNKKDACGLSFSVEHENYPPSLRNIFKELQNDLGIEIPKTGNLEPWAREKVLLLNSILTVEEDKSLSHKDIGWTQYTDYIIQKVIDCKNPLVVICWGSYAKNKLQNLRIHGKVKVITGGHPSPLNRNNDFFNGKYFSKANEFLKQNNIVPIDWRL